MSTHAEASIMSTHAEAHIVSTHADASMCRQYGKAASREAFEHSVLLDSADIDAESLAQPHAYVDLRPYMDLSPPSVRSDLTSLLDPLQRH